MTNKTTNFTEAMATDSIINESLTAMGDQSMRSTSKHEDTQVTVQGESLSDRLRFGAVMPVAAGVTLGLLYSMASFVAAEFTPQDKSETLAFEINPVEDDLPPPTEIPAPDPLKQIEVPPPPPEIEVVKTAKVDVPKVPIGDTVPDLDLKRIKFDMELGDLVVVDGNEEPILRIPPIFPARFMQGNYSGYCKVRFDISAQGLPYNVETTSCTNRQLSAPTVKSVQKWKYKPKVQNGQAVSRSGLETIVRFDLQDERGRTLPVPSAT